MTAYAAGKLWMIFMWIFNGVKKGVAMIQIDMIRNWLVGLGSLALFACSGSTYIGEVVEEEEAPLSGPVPIVLSLGMSDFEILTRGNGEVNNGNDASFWNKVRFYVYAFNKNPDTDLSVPWSEGNQTSCLLDGNRSMKAGDGATVQGKEVGIRKENSNLLIYYPDEESYVIYYNMDEVNMPYNFFAYYLDDWQGECHREKDRIYYDVELDGRRDFMSAFADPYVQQEKFEGNPYKDKILDRAFSAYSANHGLNPVFQLQHHLALFRFVVCRPDENQFDVPALDPSLAVKKIEVESDIKGRFTVAVSQPLSTDPEFPHRGISFDVSGQRTEYLELKKKDGTPLGDDVWCTVADCPMYNDTDITPEDKKNFRYVLGKVDKDDKSDSGSSLLLAPADVYNARITLTTEKGLTDEKYAVADVELVNMHDTRTFEPGKAYTIYLTVNSLSDITLQVEVGDWENGGNVDLNPDEEFQE